VRAGPGRAGTAPGGTGTVTVGIDIGTTAVKAVAAWADGTVAARARVPHRLVTPGPELLEHDAARAWRRGPLQALAEVATGLEVAGVCVASMVPSLTVVDRRGMPRSPGLLYGDARGRRVPLPPRPAARHGAGGGSGGTVSGAAAGGADGTAGAGGTGGADGMPDAEGFLRWAAAEAPGAAGYWPAQAVAGFALARVPAIDTAMGSAMGPLLRYGDWDDDVLERLGVSRSQLPTIVPMGAAAGTVAGSGAVLAGGTVDALCDQIVAGAEDPGDVLVIFGATLVVWAVTDTWIEVPGLWTVPHTVPDRVLVGGPSNAGALFVDWARGLLAGGARRPPAGVGVPGSAATGHPHATEEPPRAGHPERVPVWLPYVRGERVLFHDPSLRAAVVDLDITHDAGALERAAYEASGFVIRQVLERAGIAGRRVVASGGGTRVLPWMQAVADATGLPVDLVAVPEGAALGAAYLARMAAGAERDLDGARRWARVGRRVLPDPAWQDAAARRYRRFVAAGPGG